MRRRTSIPGPWLIPGLGLLIACTGLPGDPPPGAERRPGFELYTKYCARCHGQDGMSERATRIARDSVSLVDPEWKRTATLEEIADAVRRGTGRMEGFGGELSDEEIREVAGYVKWLPAPEASPR